MDALLVYATDVSLNVNQTGAFMHIGILQTGHVAEALIPEHGDYDQIFPAFLSGQGFSFTNYAVVDMEFPTAPDVVDGWLITGSKHGAYEDHPWIKPLEDLIRDIYARAIPLVGICFGHQIIAQALGGKVEKFAGGWAVGRQVYELDGVGDVAINAWHQDQVTHVPSDAVVIGRNAFCENAALVYGDKALSFQPHPEFTRDYTEGLLRVRGPGVVPDDLLHEAATKLDVPVARDEMARHIAKFFRAKGATHV